VLIKGVSLIRLKALLDFIFSTRQNGPPESDQAQELTYEDIDAFLATF